MEENQGMQQEKTFTQEEVNRIVQDRVARVKSESRPPEDYEDLKEVSALLEEFEFTGTPAEKKAALKQAAETRRTNMEVERLRKEAETTGTSPELLARIEKAEKEAEAANKKLAAIEKVENDKKEVVQKQTAEQQAAAKQIEEFKSDPKTKDIDVDALLNKNPRFDKFMKGKVIYSLVDAYLDFVELIGEAEREAIIKVMSKEERSTSSGKGVNSGGNYGLTQEQMLSVDEWNEENPHLKMSYKQFAEKNNRR